MESTRSSSSDRQMSGRYQNHVARKRDEALAYKKSLSEIREEPGSSNAGKYKGVKSFCGPAGGAAQGTYPVNTLERGKSALKLAHNAPNPEGIKECVYNKYPQLKRDK
ncbi:MAG: hypothetical protein QGI18_05855 [Candidatus Marinimicrobia bacterium]|jgi:hypothetical protein|nr:hypothetical protein [Candidatus Neomarinimicrobiota bacterium]